VILQTGTGPTGWNVSIAYDRKR